MYDDRCGDGDYFCRNPDCGAGKGLTFLMKFKGWNRAEADEWVRTLLGDPLRQWFAPDPQVPRIRIDNSSDRAALTTNELERRRRAHMLVLNHARRIGNDPAGQYLASRLRGLKSVPEGLLYHPGLPYFHVEVNGTRRFLGKHPAMVAAVSGPGGGICNVHRTYLTSTGEKANLIHPETGELLPCRKLMPGLQIKGGAVQLGDGEPNDLGVAEGLETAIAASLLFGIPTWSVLSTSGMEAFVVPEWVSRLTIYADFDLMDSKGRRPGIVAANGLQQRSDIKARIAAGTLQVVKRRTAIAGTDFVDLLAQVGPKA